jgi:signal recognition particle receptor subunit beta
MAHNLAALYPNQGAFLRFGYDRARLRARGFPLAVINFARREIEAKIVFYGPAMSGKTTNVHVAHSRLPEDQRGNLHTLSTDEERTLFFDYVPIQKGEIAGFTAKFKLFSVPGQVFYQQTRRVVLRGADAVVFVADSAPDRAQANIDSLIDLEENLRAHGLDLASIPLVVQLNKRDHPQARSIEAMTTDLNPFGVPVLESVATRGEGVMETLEAVIGIASARIRDNLAGRKTAVALTAIDQREPEEDEVVIRRHLKEIQKVRPEEERLGAEARKHGQVATEDVDAFLLQNVERAEKYLQVNDGPSKPRRAQLARPRVTGVPDLPPGPSLDLPFLPATLQGYRAMRIIESSITPTGGVKIELLLEPTTGGAGATRCTLKLKPELHKPPPAPVVIDPEPIRKKPVHSDILNPPQDPIEALMWKVLKGAGLVLLLMLGVIVGLLFGG